MPAAMSIRHRNMTGCTTSKCNKLKNTVQHKNTQQRPGRYCYSCPVQLDTLLVSEDCTAIGARRTRLGRPSCMKVFCTMARSRFPRSQYSNIIHVSNISVPRTSGSLPVQSSYPSQSGAGDGRSQELRPGAGGENFQGCLHDSAPP